MADLNFESFGSRLKLALWDSLEQQVDEAVITARSLAPRGETGHLYDSIHKESLGNASFAVVADADYAAAKEFGTSDESPEPFMRPAMATMKANLLRNLARDMKRAMGAK